MTPPAPWIGSAIKAATVSDLSLALGGHRFAGEMTSLLAPPYDTRLSLSAAQIDLDQLGGDRKPEPDASDEAVGSAAGGALPTPSASPSTQT